MSSFFNIEMCNFFANRATVPFIESNGYSRDDNIQYYGRGGGLLLTAARNSSFYIRNCDFHWNEAVWGGGIALFVLDRVRSAQIVFFNCTISNNKSPKYGGGGLLIQYWTGISKELQGNLVIFQTCSFYQNRAVFGGALELIGGILGTANETLIHFLECIFMENRANSSAAVDVTQIKQASLQATLVIIFTQCEFLGNAVVDEVENLHGNNSHAIQIRSGKGTFTLLYLTVRFARMVRFENNTGTALYILAGVVRFEQGVEAYFVNNCGHSGGAIALMVSALMFVEADSSVYFIRNSAISRGGAIFALSIGLHNLHKLVVTTCFFGNSAPGCQDTISFYFSGNKAAISGGSIYSNNLQACYAECSWNDPIQPDSVFSCYGRMYFCDECEESDCFHTCNSQATGRIGGPAHRFETTNSVPINTFPGHEFNLSIVVYDIFDNIVNGSFYLAHLDDQSTAESDTETQYQYVTQNKFKVNSLPLTNTTLVLHKTGLLDFKLRLGVKMQPCPPGYTLNKLKSCTCVDRHENAQYWGVLCSERASITHGKWIGYIGEPHPTNLYTSLCPTGYCSYNTTHTSYSSSYIIPLNSSELNTFLCSPTRQGRVCGECIPETSVYYHSPQFSCRSDNGCKLGWLWYMLSELVPITIVYIVIMMMNISFTSGAAKGFIFFAQVIETLDVNANGVNGLNPNEKWLTIAGNIHNFIYNAFNLEFFSHESLAFCLWKGAGTLDIVIMKYVTMTYAFLLVTATVFVLNRFQPCCKWGSSGKSYIIHGLSAFLITCYVQCMRISFLILLPTHLNGLGSSHRHYHIVFYSGNLDFWKGRHLLYAIPALVCLLFMVLLPPLALVIYPLYLRVFAVCGLAESKAVKYFSIPFEKSKPFFDSFQSCYKNNFRFVAGLFFIYRLTILLSYGLSVGHEIFYLAVMIQLVVMTLLHFLMQPNRCQLHNVLDVLIFSNLSAINGLSLYRLGVSYQHNTYAQQSVRLTGYVQLILTFLPFAVVVLCILAKTAKAIKALVCKIRKRESLLVVDSFLDNVDYSSYHSRSIRLASFN